MYKFKLLTCITMVFLTQLIQAQPAQNFTFSLTALNNQGKYRLSNPAPQNTHSYFYLTGDGFFQTRSGSIRYYPLQIGANSYEATSFELDPYGTEPPKKGTKLTNHNPDIGYQLTTPTLVPYPTTVGLSWSPNQFVYNYFILKAIPQRDKDCLEYYYNTEQVTTDHEERIKDKYANTKWFAARDSSTININGYNKKYIWNINDITLPQGDTGLIYIPMLAMGPVGSTFKIGHKFCNESVIRETTFQVSGVPYDPNTIEAHEECFYQCLSEYPYEIGEFPSHRIRYVVKFQNEGTGPANNVRVVIPLDNGVNPATIKFLDSEYPFTYFVQDQRLVVDFLDINLPGIAQLSPIITFDESQAWFNFSICTYEGNPGGPNPPLIIQPKDYCYKHQAAIYFDSNPPVYTNTAKTCVICNNSSQNPVSNLCETHLENVGNRSKINIQEDIRINPNPATDIVKFSLNKPMENTKVTIYDQTGRVVLSNLYDVLEQTTQVDVSSLAAGTYTIKLSSDNYSNILRFIKQ